MKKIYLIVLILLIFIDKANSKIMVLDKLDNPGTTLQNQKWSFVTDGVMGGLSSGKVNIENIKGVPCYRMTGNVTTENNGGFIQMRTLMAPKIDTDKYQGIYLKVYGNNKYYSIHLRTRYTIAPWQYYSFDFFASKEWVEIKAPFKEFSKSNFYQPKKLENQEVNSIGLIAGFENFKANICMAEIGLY